MKILVMGSGAVGSYYGAVLHRAGHEVTFVARGEHLEAIKSHGLRVESVASGDFTIRPSATARPDGSLDIDLALFGGVTSIVEITGTAPLVNLNAFGVLPTHRLAVS